MYPTETKFRPAPPSGKLECLVEKINGLRDELGSAHAHSASIEGLEAFDRLYDRFDEVVRELDDYCDRHARNSSRRG